MRKMRRGLPDRGALLGGERGFCKRRTMPIMWRMCGSLPKRGYHLKHLCHPGPTHGGVYRKSYDASYEYPAFPGRGQRGTSPIWQKGTLSVKKAVRLLISGRVQGVFYRYTAQKVALRLDLNGWVKNLPSGQVEAVAVGTSSAIDTFITWCREGPPGAHVTEVAVAENPSPPDDEGFSVIY